LRGPRGPGAGPRGRVRRPPGQARALRRAGAVPPRRPGRRPAPRRGAVGSRSALGSPRGRRPRAAVSGVPRAGRGRLRDRAGRAVTPTTQATSSIRTAATVHDGGQGRAGGSRRTTCPSRPRLALIGSVQRVTAVRASSRPTTRTTWPRKAGAGRLPRGRRPEGAARAPGVAWRVIPEERPSTPRGRRGGSQRGGRFSSAARRGGPEALSSHFSRLLSEGIVAPLSGYPSAGRARARAPQVVPEG